MPVRFALLIAASLLGFAANSLLCRLALGQHTIDPASFTAIRIVSGALALALLVSVPRKTSPWKAGGNLLSGLLLVGYAIAFSMAYLSLSAGTGALILFGSVQVTMLVYGVVNGERPTGLAWFGVAIAMGGLVWLVLPGLKSPSLFGAVLMMAAGAAWGGYSIRGRGAVDPSASTAGNFAFASPFALAICLIGLPLSHVSTIGVVLAILSGAVTSGPCYVLWYTVLPKLTTTRAAVLQLAVPAIAATGGVLFLSEDPTLRLAVSALLTLGGVAITLAAKPKPASR